MQKILFSICVVVLMMSACLRGWADENVPLEVQLVSDQGQAQTVFTYSAEDIDKAFIEKGAYGEFRVVVILQKSKWKDFEKFTAGHFGKTFRLLWFGEAANEGKILGANAIGRIMVAHILRTREEAEAIAEKLQRDEGWGYRDAGERERRLMEAGRRHSEAQHWGGIIRTLLIGLVAIVLLSLFISRRRKK